MTKKLFLRTNEEILKDKGKTQEFSYYPQLKPKFMIEGDMESKKIQKELREIGVIQWN